MKKLRLLKLKHTILPALSLIVIGLAVINPSISVFADPVLTIQPLTWNVIGLDSNNVSVGPDVFPVGARVCNTGTDPATNVTSSFVWDTTPSPAYINLRPGSLTTYSGSNAVASLAPGSCHDFYYEVQITRDPAAYDKTRQYHITASADGPITVSTATPREIFVEHLISQSRNSTTDVKLDGVSVPAGGTMTLMVGETYTIDLMGSTATNGYEQIESYINFSNTIFSINSVTTTYSADSGTDSLADTKPYADGCSWENDPNSPNYRSCLSTGKYGGDVTVSYNLTIIGGGGTTQTLNTLIYDFSGSSYHYNSDYSVAGRIAAIIDPSLITITKNFAPDPTNAGGISTLTFTLTNPNAVAIDGANFTDTFPTSPGAMTVADPATYSTSSCGTPTFTPVAGAASISFSNGTIPPNGTCTVSVQVAVPSVGTYNNTSSNLLIDSLDTGSSASDNLIVNTEPAPPSPICGLVMAQWTVPSTATDPPDTAGVPTVLASDVLTALASAGPGISANTGIATSEGQNDSYSWRTNGGFEPGVFDPANNDYFQFQIDTREYTEVNLNFYARRTNNGPKDLYVYYDTAGSPPGTLKAALTDASGLVNASTWYSFTVDFTGNTSTTGDTYFYIFGADSAQSNPGADIYIDLITFTGCAVPNPPTITKAFSPDPIAVNGTSTLTFTLTNPNLAAINGVTFNDSLPEDLEVASTPNAITTCGGSPTWAPSGGDTDLAFGSPTGGAIAAGSSCTVQVDITATTAGPHTNVSGFISSTETGVNTGSDGSASDTLTALAAPIIAKQFSPNPILVNEVSTLTFTITNPNPNNGLSSVAFADNYPPNVVNAASPSTATSCGGTITAAAGAGTISFSGGTIAGGGTCTVQVDVTSSTDGTYANTSGDVSAAIVGNGNTASDTLYVEPVRPSIALLKQVSTSSSGPWTSFAAVTAGDDIYYQLTIENTGDVALSPVTVTDPDIDTSSCTWPDPLPVAVAANENHVAVCVTDPITAVSGSHPNTATANGTYGGSVYSDTSTATYATTGLTLVKSVAESFYLAEGDVLNYSYLVTNSGFAPLAGPVTISDDKSTDETCPGVSTIGDGDAFLEPGESITCTATYTVTASDMSALSVTNTASATVDGINSNTDDETVPLTTQPSISVMKEVSVDGGSSWGDADSAPGPSLISGTDPRFRFTVSNTGNVALTNITLSDTDIGSFYQSDLATACTIPDPLALGSNFVCYGTLAWNTGQHTNTATASGDFNSSTYSDTDDANYLGISPPNIAKNFAPDPIEVGGTSTLSFTITNPNTGTALSGVSFSDTLPVSPGAMVVANPSNASTNCGGTVTAAAGTGSITFSGGTVAASGTCTVSVDITIPVIGTYNNTSGNVSSTNGGTGNTASDSLLVADILAPGISKNFSPDPIMIGDVSTLSFTITNPNTITALTGVAFTDDLPGGLEVASSPNASTASCGSPTWSPAAGEVSLSFSSGTIAASGTCTVEVDVTATSSGAKNNTSSTVSSTNGGTGNSAADTLTVLATPSFSINDVTVNESDGTATFTVSLSGLSSKTITVDYATADNTAAAGVDYTTTTGTLTFAPGETTKTVPVPILEDLIDEFDETFFVNLSNATNSTIADGTGVGTILDNDALPSFSINDVTVNESDGTATFSVSLSGPSGKTITVDYATADNTAAAGADYTTTTGMLTFDPGETTKTVPVPIIEDLIDEDDETFFVNLSNATNSTIADGTGIGTILDNDALPSFSINDVIVDESDGTATFTVSLSGPSGKTITVDYATADNTAIAGVDYTNTSGMLTFDPGETTKTVPVPILEDLIDEYDETFFVNLSNAVNSTIADDTGIGTILDNDVSPSFSINDVIVDESDGTAMFTVSLSGPSSKTITVDYATADNTATSGADYTTTTGTLTFNPGDTTKTVPVPIIEDLIDEYDETFFVNLSNAVNSTIADDTGIGTILDNDSPPSFSINDVIVDESDGTATFTVSLSGPSGKTITVNYATADNTAVAGADYTTTTGTLTFNPGETTKTVSVPIIDDIFNESTETFFVNLSNAVNSTIADGTGIGTILDNDSPPSISKNFSPDPITAGEVSTLSFIITNPNSSTVLDGLTFSDTFPASPGAMVVASTPNTTTTCGGTVTAVAGAGSMTFSGGTVAANSTCSVTVDVTAPAMGTYNNTSSNVSSTNGGTGNTASDSLTVSAAIVIDPAVTKTGNPATAQVGDVVTFTLEVFNTGNTDATNVVVTDIIPAFLDISSVTVVPTTPPISIVGNTITLTFATVTPSDLFTITITTVVNNLGSPPGGTNTATLAASADNNSGNNSDTTAIEIFVGASDLRAPETGFAPGRTSQIQRQTADLEYSTYGELRMEIPALGLKAPIVGVPATKNGWDVTWLWNQVGYLQGTAFPGWSGNSVLTSHVYLSNGLPGPFAELRQLKFGDRVMVESFGLRYVYEVRDSDLYRPDDASIIRHEERPWLTLITCHGYDEARDIYRWRRVVRAVLIDVETVRD